MFLYSKKLFLGDRFLTEYSKFGRLCKNCTFQVLRSFYSATIRCATFNYYEVLGLKGNEDCSQQEIRNAYLKKCKELHPDRNIETTEGQKTLSEEDSKRLFQEVNEAYSILSKENERSSYDLFLKQSSTRSYTNNFNQRQYSNTGFTGTKRYPFDNDVFKQYEEFKKRREREEEMFGYKFREYSEKSGTDFRGHYYNPSGSSYQRPRRRPYNPYRNPLFETANRTSRILIFCFTLMLIGNILRFVVYEYKMARDSEYGLRETQRLSREYVDAREKARWETAEERNARIFGREAERNKQVANDDKDKPLPASS